MKDVFPYLQSEIVYLDSAASTQKPRSVLKRVQEFYESEYANVHRGIYRLAESATLAYEQARQTIATHIGAKPEQLIFTCGTTDAMNLLASTYPLTNQDRVVVALHDHHSTFVPWQQAASKIGATVHIIPCTKQGTLDYQAAQEIINQGCSVLATLHVSNVTGEVVDIKKLSDLVHAQDGKIFVDGAQALAHLDIDVTALDVDAYCVSSHKAYGPTGVGALYMHEDLAEFLPPYRYGGEMVDQVTREKTTFKAAPYRFEAGTPAIAQAVGFAAAIEFLQSMQETIKNEKKLVVYLYEQLQSLDFVTIIGTQERIALVSFTVSQIHAHDVAQFLDTKGIAVRAGHHCTQPYHDSHGIDASVRASIGVYNTTDDIDKLILALKECKEAFDV